MLNPSYSDAARCLACSFKAALSEPQADALASASEHGLVPCRCPYGNGWHVRIDEQRFPRARRPPPADYP